MFLFAILFLLFLNAIFYLIRIKHFLEDETKFYLDVRLLKSEIILLKKNIQIFILLQITPI